MHTQRFLDRAQMAPGVVTELVVSTKKVSSTTYKPLVRFETPSGAVIDFTSSVASAPAAYRVGEPVTVFFDPANPSEARVNGFFELWGIASIAGVVGTVFFLVGVGFGTAKWFYGRKLARLSETGDLVLATFDKVEPDAGTTLNNRHPWRVHAHWIDPLSGKRHLFTSEMLWEDPTERAGQSLVRVYVERGNPKRYAMDLS
ncbi:hypothetical protein LPB72_06495 [Hydrogenophaga crassostreae]|uniref:DUF3592 domain-containing protein n=2 Tax=Hydrogenophaga crassostreae TaxID=1763535 RepID=A0A162W189_9BURK|nr:hypothetical protein LPB072_16220 [Hydrogenophaga crassostreae]OAD42928.1 hypothetical protein LPB72_06495 [Hydrogenophaga crassostreae]